MVGQIQFEFADWQQRGRPAQLMNEIRDNTADIPGIKVEVTAPQAGPPTGKAIQVQLSSDYPGCARRPPPSRSPRELAKRPEIVDLDSGLPLPGIDWQLQIDKAEAAKYGVSVGAVGQVVQLVTNGLKITDYRPADTDKPVDIIVRVPADKRTLSQIDALEVQTPAGSVPISNFVTRVPAPSVGQIHRVDAHRVITVTANVAPGVDVERPSRRSRRSLPRPTSRAW